MNPMFLDIATDNRKCCTTASVFVLGSRNRLSLQLISRDVLGGCSSSKSSAQMYVENVENELEKNESSIHSRLISIF